ncbi:MAG: CPBP family intramembrane glutamic endopeptidase [Opitutales bacterium]
MGEHVKRVGIWLEWFCLYAALPGLLYLDWLPIERPFALLPPILVYTAWVYRRLGTPRLPRDPRWHPGPMLARAGVGTLLLVPLTLELYPDMFLGFIQRSPGFFLLVCVLYPILSVWPQEFLYRRFYFARYAGIIPGGNTGLVLSSALLFGWLHIIFGNWLSVSLTLVGGWLFSDTYRRSGSLSWASVEHAIYGIAIFAVGLGRFFVELR